MGRWTAESDRDYRDVPENAPTPCATVGCDGHVTFPDRESFCTPCLIAQRSDNYILNDAGEPEVVDLITWVHWIEANHDQRQLAHDQIGATRVSTVFLGLDHSFGVGDPVLWETMIFGGAHDGYQDRYTSRADALAGHAKAVALVNEPSNG